MRTVVLALAALALLGGCFYIKVREGDEDRDAPKKPDDAAAILVLKA